MNRLASRYLCSSVVGVVLLAGCATLPAPESQPGEGPARYQRLRDSVRLARSLEADEVPTAPRIRLVVPPAMNAGSQYVEASFQLSSDAYVFVVAVDLDRRVRVLYPETPEQSGFAARSNANRLSRFFAGFARPGRTSAHDARYDATGRISPLGGAGVLLAVASDRPLQLERLLDASGEWDEAALMELVFDESLSGAAHAVGRAVVLTGQDYNTDYSTFGGRRTLVAYRSFASSSFGDCGYGYAYGDGYGYNYGYGGAADFGLAGHGSGYFGYGQRLIGLYTRNGITFARYAIGGGCGTASYYDVPVNSARPLPGAPRVPGAPLPVDTTTSTRRPRFPGAPRFPITGGDSGTHPLLRRGAPADAGDRGMDRPFVTSGLRFRPPEQLPTERLRPLEALMSPRDAADWPERRRAAVADEQRSRRNAPEADGGEAVRAVERSQPPEWRPAPQRAEPVHHEPVRSEPVRAEPARSEPVRSEPVQRAPAQHDPAPAPVRPPSVR